MFSIASFPPKTLEGLGTFISQIAAFCNTVKALPEVLACAYFFFMTLKFFKTIFILKVATAYKSEV